MTFLAKWPGPIATISIAQLFGTSLWFSANAATVELMSLWHVGEAEIGWLTSAVQGGFIVGTLILSLTGIADKYRASYIFAVSATFGAFFNLCFVIFATDIWLGLLLRFLVGLALGGIYPVGMKMIVKWTPDKSGWGLSVLVAMLTLGTALPHGLRASATSYSWFTVVSASSFLALVGAVLVFRLGDGPSVAKVAVRFPAQETSPLLALKAAVSRPAFRRAALGYFGHMWELYAFWTIVPFLVSRTVADDAFSIAIGSFVTISVGAVGCLLGGVASRGIASSWIAGVALTFSCTCCVVFALFGQSLSPGIALLLLILWGATVVADSPQFSAMSARACPAEILGSALSIQNAIGFALTMISILIVTKIIGSYGLISILILAVGPILGVAALLHSARRRQPDLPEADIP